MIAVTGGETFVSLRAIGLRKRRGLSCLRPEPFRRVNDAISSLFSGTFDDLLHCGQGPCLPANLSLTLETLLAAWQTNRIA